MAIADKARDFWDRISPRERKLVVLLGFAAPITIALWLGFAIRDGLVAMEVRNENTRKALRIVADLKSRGPVTPTDDVVAMMGIDPVPLNTYLTNAASKAGFTLKGTTPRTAITKNSFVTNSVTLQVQELTIEQLKKFLHEIENSKVVVITQLAVKKNFKARTEKGSDKLDATLEVSTYSKEPPKKDEKDGGSGASDDKKKGG